MPVITARAQHNVLMPAWAERSARSPRILLDDGVVTRSSAYRCRRQRVKRICKQAEVDSLMSCTRHHAHKQPGRLEPRSSRRCAPEATGSFNQTDHLRCCIDGKRVRSETRPWQDESGHLAGQGALPIRRICQQRNHQVLQGDHAHMQPPQFGLGQWQFVRFSPAYPTLFSIHATTPRKRTKH